MAQIFVKQLHERKFDVFLDLKYHDIPNTVARAVRSAADLGVWMVDLHASGGLAMMEQARKILEPYGKDAPLLIAVTVLTSMEDLDLLQIRHQCFTDGASNSSCSLGSTCGL